MGESYIPKFTTVLELFFLVFLRLYGSDSLVCIKKNNHAWGLIVANRFSKPCKIHISYSWSHIHSWKKVVTPHLRQWNQHGSNFCASSGLKLTWNAPVTAPQWNPTLPWSDFHLMPSGIAGVQSRSSGGHFPKSAFVLWPFRINNCIIFSQFSLIVLIMPRPTPIGIRHTVLALACQGMRQSTIAGCVGLSGATVNRILQRHVAAGTLVPCKSMGAPRKIIHRQAHVYSVWSDRITWLVLRPL